MAKKSAFLAAGFIRAIVARRLALRPCVILSRMRARETAAVAALLLALAVQLGLAVQSDGLTSDELLYIPAGYLHVARFDLSLDTTHPPLAAALAGLGLAGAGVVVPERAPGEEPLAYCLRLLH